MKDIIQGFLSGVGFILASLAVAFFMHNSFLAMVIIALLCACFWQGRQVVSGLKTGLTAIRDHRNSASDVQKFLDACRQWQRKKKDN
jgi:hypothetical protein